MVELLKRYVYALVIWFGSASVVQHLPVRTERGIISLISMATHLLFVLVNYLKAVISDF